MATSRFPGVRGGFRWQNGSHLGILGWAIVSSVGAELGVVKCPG